MKYVLLFYYYGGMVYTCLHNYLNALLFFTVVSTCTYVHTHVAHAQGIMYFLEQFSVHEATVWHHSDEKLLQ